MDAHIKKIKIGKQKIDIFMIYLSSWKYFIHSFSISFPLLFLCLNFFTLINSSIDYGRNS